MATYLIIPEIETRLIAAAKEFSNYCLQLSDEDFFHQPEGKWSAAQQVKHLIVSANMSRLAFVLPKFIFSIASCFARTISSIEEIFKKKINSPKKKFCIILELFVDFSINVSHKDIHCL